MKHLSLLQLKPPRSALALTNFATEVTSNLRTNAESLHTTVVILELTQFWVATSHKLLPSLGIPYVQLANPYWKMDDVCATTILMFVLRTSQVKSNKNNKVIWQTSTEYFQRECLMGGLNMPFPITLRSNLFLARGTIFPSHGPLLSSGCSDQTIYLESTSATSAAVLHDQISPMYYAHTIDVFSDTLSTLHQHCHIISLSPRELRLSAT